MNFTGQLGNGWAGIEHHQALPVVVQRINNAVDVVASGLTTCALRSDGSVSCWGLASDSLLDSLLTWEPVELSQLPRHPIPQQVTNLASLTNLSLGLGEDRFGACGLDDESVLRCWGMTPHSIEAVAAVSRHYHCASPTACYGCLVKTNGEVFCAGDNTYGQLGVGVRGEVSTDPVSDLTQVHKVVTGSRHACALTQVGTVYCWGSEEGLAQEAPERHCDGFNNNGDCLGEKRYSALPLEVVFD
jgi:alpha-tubulin suppressor-like RCC1 family protein